MSKRENVVKMDQSQVIFLHDILKKVCKNRKGNAVYVGEHSDDTVLAEVNLQWAEKQPGKPFTFNNGHVRTLRTNMIGVLKNVGKRKPLSKDEDIDLGVMRADLKSHKTRIEILENQVSDLNLHVQELIVRMGGANKRPQSRPRGMFDELPSTPVTPTPWGENLKK